MSHRRSHWLLLSLTFIVTALSLLHTSRTDLTRTTQRLGRPTGQSLHRETHSVGVDLHQTHDKVPHRKDSREGRSTCQLTNGETHSEGDDLHQIHDKVPHWKDNREDTEDRHRRGPSHNTRSQLHCTQAEGGAEDKEKLELMTKAEQDSKSKAVELSTTL